MEKWLEWHKLPNLTKEIEIAATDRPTKEIPSLYGFTGKCLQTFKEAQFQFYTNFQNLTRRECFLTHYKRAVLPQQQNQRKILQENYRPVSPYEHT